MKKALLTIAIVVAFALAAAKVTGLIRELDATASEARQTAREAKVLTLRVHRLTAENRGLVTSLQSAIVESCEVNGNSRAEVQRETLHEELHEAEHPDPVAFRALVEAGIPAQTIDALEAKQIGKLKIRLGRVHIANCQSQYRISPGSGARRRAKP